MNTSFARSLELDARASFIIYLIDLYVIPLLVMLGSKQSRALGSVMGSGPHFTPLRILRSLRCLLPAGQANSLQAGTRLHKDGTPSVCMLPQQQLSRSMRKAIVIWLGAFQCSSAHASSISARFGHMHHEGPLQSPDTRAFSSRKTCHAGPWRSMSWND